MEVLPNRIMYWYGFVGNRSVAISDDCAIEIPGRKLTKRTLTTLAQSVRRSAGMRGLIRSVFCCGRMSGFVLMFLISVGMQKSPVKSGNSGSVMAE